MIQQQMVHIVQENTVLRQVRTAPWHTIVSVAHGYEGVTRLREM